MTDLIKRDDAPEPCPFCKCEEVTTWFDREQGEKWGYASCDGCAARGPEVRTNWDREPDAPWHSEAIAAWNTRADADRIEQLERERDEIDALAHKYMDRLEQSEAKLAKAVEYFKKLDRRGDALETFDPVVHEIVIAALAELEGETK